MEVRSQFQAPAVLNPGKSNGNHFTGGWVEPRDCLDVVTKTKGHSSVGKRTSVVQRVASHYIH